MDVNEKLERFGQSLEDVSNKEYREIEEVVEQEIKSGIEQEITEYENKKKINYEKTIQRIEKDYNKKVFSYELNCKKQIIDEGKKLKEKIKAEAICKLKEFIKTEKYKDVLINSIEERYIKN